MWERAGIEPRVTADHIRVGRGSVVSARINGVDHYQRFVDNEDFYAWRL